MVDMRGMMLPLRASMRAQVPWGRHLGMLVFSLSCLMGTGGCPFHGEVYEDDMVGGYVVWASDVMEQAAVFLKDRDDRGGTEVIPCMVYAYGWNDDFIIAKQRSTKYSRTTSNSTQWYVIEVQKKQVHGPLSQDEFQKLRAELCVPKELSFTKEVQ